MSTMFLDHLDRIEIDPAQQRRYHNELQVLGAWQHGLRFLYQQVRTMQQIAVADLAASSPAQDSSNQTILECAFPNLSCCFQ